MRRLAGSSEDAGAGMAAHHTSADLGTFVRHLVRVLSFHLTWLFVALLLNKQLTPARATFCIISSILQSVLIVYTYYCSVRIQPRLDMEKQFGLQRTRWEWMHM